jgi:hypothetical protein
MGEEADNNSLGKMRGQINASWKTRDACRVRKKPTSGVEVGVVEFCGSWEK